MTMVVDSHQHFWDPDRREYPWLTEPQIRRRFGPEHLAPQLTKAGVDRTVLIQTVATVDETMEFLTIASETTFVAGVVGWIALGDPHVMHALARIRATPHGRLLVGIRHNAHEERDPRWLMRREVRRGIEAVGAAGLAYDLQIRTREAPAALEIVKSLTDVRFVIDHVAKPQIAKGPRDVDWERAFRPFGDCPNVTCKLSGMVPDAPGMRWSADDIVPYVQRVLTWFGPERCMFGSDWPVCLVAASYGEVIRATRHAIGSLDAAARARVMGINAMRVYRLQPVQ